MIRNEYLNKTLFEFLRQLYVYVVLYSRLLMKHVIEHSDYDESITIEYLVKRLYYRRIIDIVSVC